MTQLDEMLVVFEGATFDWPTPGTPVFLSPGDVVHRDHPIVVGHEHLFRPLRLKFDVAKKEPERIPVASAKASAQGARTR